MPISSKPWGNFSEADYTLEQYARATKAACKLAVREPDGTLNRNGVHAAAGALAGARQELKAPVEKKRAAARKVIALYRQMGEIAPTARMMSRA